MGIRTFTVGVLLVAIAVTAAVVWRGTDGEREFPEMLEEAINCMRMKTYHDSVYDYEVDYPEFFEQVPDSLIDEPGCSQFRYWDNWVQVELTAQVLPLSAVPNRQETFVSAGPLLMNGSEIPGYCFHAKYVRHRRLWFVLTLTYPEHCAKAVRRLVQKVDRWQVWEQP